jgi:hypothetical protein
LQKCQLFLIYATFEVVIAMAIKRSPLDLFFPDFFLVYSFPEDGGIICFRNVGLFKKTPWSESASELYRPSDRRLSAK